MSTRAGPRPSSGSRRQAGGTLGGTTRTGSIETTGAVVGAGAAGLLPTRLEDGALCLALQDVHTVGFHMGTYLRTYLCGQQVKGLRSKERKGHGLTASELKVLQECADRARPTRREVAKRLKVGISTVTTHLKHIRAKWNVHDMGAMMRHAVRNEWVD